MKITKSELKKLLVEEMQSDPNLLKAIKELTGAIGDLDVSIDYLSAAVTGENPFSIALQQKGFGRLAKPPEKVRDLSEILAQYSADDMEDYNYSSKGEGSMARSQLGRTAEIAMMVQEMIDDNDDLEEWVESKITKANDYLSTVLNYMRGEKLSERVYDRGEKRPAEIIRDDLRDVITCYMQELVEMGHDYERVVFGMERLISDIQISGGRGAKCDSVAVRPTVDPTDVPLRRVAEKKLTDAEFEKKKEIAAAIKRDDPSKPDSERYAIATAAAKKSVKKKQGKK